MSDRLEEMARAGVTFVSGPVNVTLEGLTALLAQARREGAEEKEKENERLREYLTQIDRETRSVSDVRLLRIGSIARAALAQPEAAPKRCRSCGCLPYQHDATCQTQEER